MNENIKKNVVEDLLKIIDRYELSRSETEEILALTQQQFDQLAVIPQKRRCPRTEREHLA